MNPKGQVVRKKPRIKFSQNRLIIAIGLGCINLDIVNQQQLINKNYNSL